MDSFVGSAGGIIGLVILIAGAIFGGMWWQKRDGAKRKKFEKERAAHGRAADDLEVLELAEDEITKSRREEEAKKPNIPKTSFKTENLLNEARRRRDVT